MTRSTEELELDLERQRLELERKKLELELQKLELERSKSKKKKKKKKKRRAASDEGGDEARAKPKRRKKAAPAGAGSDVRKKRKKASDDANETRVEPAAKPAPPTFYEPKVAISSPTRPTPYVPIAIAAILGLGLSIGLVVAISGRDSEEQLGLNGQAPRKARDTEPVERQAAKREVERVNAAPAGSLKERAAAGDAEACLELAKNLRDHDLEGCERWLVEAQSKGSLSVRTEAGRLLDEVRHEARQHRIAKANQNEASAQDEWEAGSEEREAEETRRREVEAHVRLLDSVDKAETLARNATSASQLQKAQMNLDSALLNEACDEKVQYAVDDAKLVLETRRATLRQAKKEEAHALAAKRKYEQALALLAELTRLGEANVAGLETSWRESLAAKRKAEADAAAKQKAEQRAVAEARTAEAQAEKAVRDRKADRIAKDVRGRVKAWYKVRLPEKLACRECEGKLDITCTLCKGREWIACRECGGKGYVTVVIPSGRSLTSKGGRRIRENCRRCRTDRTEDCPKCTNGTNRCECREEVPGYRPLAGKRAFWDYISSTARKGKRRHEYFHDVIEGRALKKQIGESLSVKRAEILSVDVMDDHVVVKARCEWAGEDSSGESVSRTVWIREKGKFFLATKNDTSPEPLFEQPSK